MRIKSLILGAAAALGTMAAMAGSASAYVACNRAGDCWHTNDRAFHRSFGIVVRDNNWRLRHGMHWREHEGRGYWRNGVWIRF